MKLARRAAWIQNAREGQRGANHATTCKGPDARSRLTLGRLSKRSQVSQNRAALHKQRVFRSTATDFGRASPAHKGTGYLRR